MVYHGIRRVAAGILTSVGNFFLPGDRSEEAAGLGPHGIELDIIGYRPTDHHDIEENRNGVIALPTLDEPQVPSRSRRRRCPIKLPETPSVDVGIFVLFGILFISIFILPLDDVVPNFKYPIRFNLTELMKNSSRPLKNMTNPDIRAAGDHMAKVMTETSELFDMANLHAMQSPILTNDESPKIDATTQISKIFTFTQILSVVKTITVTQYSPDVTSVPQSASVRSPSSGNLLQGRSEMPHHAYPLHAPQKLKNGNAMKAKFELEQCAHRIIGKFNNEGIEATSGLEFMLQDCKAAIDEALRLLYHPIHIAIRDLEPPYDQNLSPRTANNEKTLVFQDLSTAPNSSECEWKRPKSFLSGQKCSHKFCDWTSKGDLHRCYEKNQDWDADKGGNQYLNDSVDDFKTGAPIECNLCLPKVDCWGIDTYCQDVETAERVLLEGLLVALGILLVGCSMIIIVKRW